jgi:hypothetical protein
VTPEEIANGILQNALEQQRQLLRRSIAILFRQFHHGILHDIQRCVIVAHGKRSLLESASFDLNQEIGKLPLGSQFYLPK